MDHESILKNVIKIQMQSTYRSDFSGIQLGTNPNIRVDKYVPEWRANINYSKESESRFHFKNDAQYGLLKNNTNRFGCNKNINRAAIGGAPNYSPYLYSLKNPNALSDVFC